MLNHEVSDINQLPAWSDSTQRSNDYQDNAQMNQGYIDDDHQNEIEDPDKKEDGGAEDSDHESQPKKRPKLEHLPQTTVQQHHASPSNGTSGPKLMPSVEQQHGVTQPGNADFQKFEYGIDEDGGAYLYAGEVEEKLTPEVNKIAAKSTPEEGEALAKDEVSKVQKKANEKVLMSEASDDDENAAPVEQQHGQLEEV